MAMYAPSFFTGRLISRFRASRIALVGPVLTGISAPLGTAGLDIPHFYLLLVLLGPGWTFWLCWRRCPGTCMSSPRGENTGAVAE